ncbi:uncharacterized protein [Amphiura filiformis]|uniref:uncharacterized protein n=1 Tax=Amphiura filiformis TaxID=82378 RepID=UPI003B225F5E
MDLIKTVRTVKIIAALTKPPKVAEDHADIIKPQTVSFHKDAANSINIDFANQPTNPEHREHTAPINETSLYLAATYVIDAKYNRNFQFKTDLRSLRLYHLYNQRILSWMLYFFVILNLLLAMFEKPAIPGWEIPYWGTMLLEVACMCYYTFRLVHNYSFSSERLWWKDAKHLVVIGIIALTILDMIIYIFVAQFAGAHVAVRGSRVLRPLLLINFPEMRLLRQAVRNIRRTLPEIINVLILLFMIIALFALLGRELFKYDGLNYINGDDGYFLDYFKNVWDLYVLVTTANSPDIMMPAYDENPWYMLFFIIFVMLCNYIFIGIFLAVIYKNYRMHLKNEVQRSVFMKRRKLAKAWDIVKVWKDNCFVLPWKRFCILLQQVEPKRSLSQIRLIWRVLDEDSDDFVSKREFLKVVDLLNVELLEIKDQQPFFQRWMPTCFNSKLSTIVRTIVKHRGFRWTFDTIIIINAILIGLDIDEAEWFFLSIFTVEILLRMYAIGFKAYFRNPWDLFDFTVITAAWVASIFEVIAEKKEFTEYTLDFLLVLRVLRLVRIPANLERFQVIIATLSNIGPAIVTFGGVIFVIYYVFAIIGMELYAGLFDYYGYEDDPVFLPFCGNKKLEGSDFYRDHYCNNNFNDVVKAFIVLFELTVVNQWHVISEGFVIITNAAARVYFIFFHMTVVIVIINIFIAFVLEIFMVEFSLSQSVHESALKKKIQELGLLATEEDDPGYISKPVVEDAVTIVDAMEEAEPKDTGLRFRLGERTRTVTVSLQNMFEGEIDAEYMGPEDADENNPNIEAQPDTLTLHSVA